MFKLYKHIIRVRGRPSGLFNPCACWRGVWPRRWLVVVLVVVVVGVGPWRDRPTQDLVFQEQVFVFNVFFFSFSVDFTVFQ